MNPDQQSFLLRYVLPHKIDPSAQTRDILTVLSRQIPEDAFSVSQWQLGIQFYRSRMQTLGLKGKLLIDVGCGTGNWSIAASTLFEQVVGIDRRQDRINAALQIAKTMRIDNIDFLVGDAANLPVTARADWIIIQNVLPYVQDLNMTLSEAAGSLADGGLLWCSWVDRSVIIYNALDAIAERSLQKVAQACVFGCRCFTPGASSGSGFLTKDLVTRALRVQGFLPVHDSDLQTWPEPKGPLRRRSFWDFLIGMNSYARGFNAHDVQTDRQVFLQYCSVIWIRYKCVE